MRIIFIVILLLTLVISNAESLTWLRRLFSRWFGYSRRKTIVIPYDKRFNNIDRPKGPPHVDYQPGPLSFNLGKLRFRQTTYDFRRNQEPFVINPGPLSFHIGPFRFTQIPTNRFNYVSCCLHPKANCRDYFACTDA